MPGALLQAPGVGRRFDLHPRSRQVEALTQSGPKAKVAKARAQVSKDADTTALERRLTDVLGLNVQIDHKSKGGVLRVRYRTLDQLDDVARADVLWPILRLDPDRARSQRATGHRLARLMLAVADGTVPSGGTPEREGEDDRRHGGGGKTFDQPAQVRRIDRRHDGIGGVAEVL